MDDRAQQLSHLERLADELKQRGLTVELADERSKPQLTVANAQTASLYERVLCHQGDDGSWKFWWPWKQPIGLVDELSVVVDKIASVLRSVEGV